MLRMCYVCAMDVQNNRSYAKESNKSKPSGVRFDLEQLDFIQKREPKLNTKQKVVDFLLNKYWWEQKVDTKPNHKGLPPEELNNMPNYQEATPAAFDGKMKRTNLDDPAMWAEAKSPITGLPPKLSLFDDFMTELNKATTIPQVEDIMKRAKGEVFTPRDKIALEAHAKEVSKEMFND